MNVSLPYRGGIGQSNLLTDSTGDKAGGKGEWNVREHAGPKHRIWRKKHTRFDEETPEVRAIEVASGNVGVSPILPGLLGQIPLEQKIGSVTADVEYDTRKCHEAIAARDSSAIIPPRKNVRHWKPKRGCHRAKRCSAIREINWVGPHVID